MKPHLLTTFCLSKSSLSCFSLLISSLRLSFALALVSSSKHREQDRLLGVPAEDMDSRPVHIIINITKHCLRLEWFWLRFCNVCLETSIFRNSPVSESSLEHLKGLPQILLWWLWWKWWCELADPSSSSLFSEESSDSEMRILPVQCGGESGLEVGLEGLFTWLWPFTGVIWTVASPFR